MNISANNFDPIEKMIYAEGLRIEANDYHPAVDVMLINLNTKAILKQTQSAYKLLAVADNAALLTYELIVSATAVLWPLLNEDLAWKVF